MRLEDLNWMDVENYLQTDDRLMLVTGACEQHAYLSLLTDIKTPLAMADAASRQTGVLVAPPLNFGVSPYFTTFPGTISLRTQTFLSVVEDVVRAVYAQGFKKLLVVNGHGGNEGAKNVLRELANTLPGLKVDWYSWWLAPTFGKVARGSGLAGYHANWMESFPFCRVAELPDGEKAPVDEGGRVLSAEETRTLLGDGSYGGYYKADDAILQRVFDACVQDIVAKLKFE